MKTASILRISLIPVPIPQSRETAILMMADSCESAIRAVKPQNNQDIADLVHGIIEGKRNNGQLDDVPADAERPCVKIEATFIDVFRGLFHPRIDYAKSGPSAWRASARAGLMAMGSRSSRV